MIYKREFKSGTGNDPRDTWYAVYKCDACGNEEWVHMSDRYTFRRVPRVCPKCHSMGAEDLRKSLEAKRDELRAEIEKVIQEINQLEGKVA